MRATPISAPSRSASLKLLPLPTVDHAEGNLLDPADVPATGTLMRVPADAGTKDLDVVHIFWVGPRDDEGSDTFKDSLPINSFSAGEELPFKIDLKYVTNNIGQSVEVYYEIIRGGQSLPSEVFEVSVGPALGNLPKPEVTEAPAGSLDPNHALQGVELVIRYDRMAAIDRITPYWRGTPGPGTPNLQPVEGNASGAVRIKIDASAVAANVGKSVELSYDVSRSGAPAKNSDKADLTVESFKPGDLPAAEVSESFDHLLDLNTFSGSATITVRPWRLIAIGQRVWCSALGTGSDGMPFSRILASSAAVNAQQVSAGLSYSLTRTDLDSLQHNSSLRLQLQVTFDGSNNISQAHPFPEKPQLIAARMQDLPAMELPQLSQGILNPMNILGNAIVKVSYPSMQPSDTLVLYYRDSDGKDQPAPSHWSGSPSQIQFLSIPPGLIGQFLGKPLTMHYRVVHADFHSPGGKGSAVTFNVGVLDVSVLRPAIPGEAKAGVLDLGTFSGDANVVLESWFLMAPLQRLWLTAVGTRTDNTTARLELARADSITPEQVGLPLVFTLKRSDLESLKQGSSLSLETSVSFDGRTQQQGAVVFPTSQVTLQR